MIALFYRENIGARMRHQLGDVSYSSRFMLDTMDRVGAAIFKAYPIKSVSLSWKMLVATTQPMLSVYIQRCYATSAK